MKNNNNPMLDIYELVQHFGGATHLSRLLTQYGRPTALSAVHSWRQRGRMPAESLVVMAVIARDHGIRFDLYDFIKMETSTSESGNPKRTDLGLPMGRQRDTAESAICT